MGPGVGAREGNDQVLFSAQLVAENASDYRLQDILDQLGSISCKNSSNI